MSYSATNGNEIEFDFSESGYSAPTGNEISFDFSTDHEIDIPVFCVTDTISINFAVHVVCAVFSSMPVLSVANVAIVESFIDIVSFQSAGVIRLDICVKIYIPKFTIISSFLNEFYVKCQELSVQILPFLSTEILNIGSFFTFLRGNQSSQNSFGAQSEKPVLAQMGFVAHQKNILDLSIGALAIQQIITKICSGNPTGQTEIILNKLVQEVSGHALIENVLSEEAKDVQQIITKLCAGDPTGQAEIILNKLAQEVAGHELIENVFSEEVKDVQQIITKLCAGDPTGQAEIILNKLAQEVAGHEEIINKLSLGIQQIQALKQTISSAEIKYTQNVLIDILEKDTASGTQIMLQSMEDQQAHFHV